MSKYEVDDYEDFDDEPPYPFVVFMQPGSKFSMSVMSLLSRRGIAYVAIDVSDPDYSADFTAMGHTDVPQVYFNERHIGGVMDLVDFLDDPFAPHS